jgi:hypothetical protein
MTLLPSPSTQASAPRALLIATLATAALLLLWAPATSLAHDAGRTGGKQAREGKTLKTAGVLRRGAGYGTDHGSAAVRRVQLRLLRLGFRPGPIDGLFGPLTHGAVERFQVARGLTVDGAVGRVTRGRLLGPARRASKALRTSRPDRPARDRSAPKQRTTDRPPAVDAIPPHDVAPEAGRARPAPQPSDGLAPGVAAGLGALAMAVLLGGAWLLGGRRRDRTAAGDGAARDRSPATSLRLGIVCAALLAVFALGAAAGALFATRASPDERQTEETHRTAATTDGTRAGEELAVQSRPQRLPSAP